MYVVILTSQKVYVTFSIESILECSDDGIRATQSEETFLVGGSLAFQILDTSIDDCREKYINTFRWA